MAGLENMENLVSTKPAQFHHVGYRLDSGISLVRWLCDKIDFADLGLFSIGSRSQSDGRSSTCKLQYANADQMPGIDFMLAKFTPFGERAADWPREMGLFRCSGLALNAPTVQPSVLMLPHPPSATPLDCPDSCKRACNIMEPIGTNIHLRIPPTPPTSLIILCTWLGGASPRRIAKYTDGYASHFPDAAILLITTTLSDITLRSFSAIRDRLAPARKRIAQLIHPSSGFNSDSDSPIPVLLHIFSHGGSNTATQLVQSIKAADPAAHRGFISALKLVIFDCCPGDSSLLRSYNAAAVSLPSPTEQPFAHFVGKSVLYPAIGTISALQAVGAMRSVEDLRTELNDPALFGTSACRFYLYSREDEMVRWQDVERHLREGREKGFVADGVRFDAGPHCALAMVDEERYWNSVQRAWEAKILSRL